MRLRNERLDFVFCRPNIAVVSSVGFDLKQIILIYQRTKNFGIARAVLDAPSKWKNGVREGAIAIAKKIARHAYKYK